MRLLCGLFLLSIFLWSCAQPIQEISTDLSASSNNEVTVDIDPTITADQYVAGLRKIKGLLLDRPFLSAQEQSVKTLEEYQSFIESYLNDPTTPLAIQKLYQRILELEGNEVITAFNNGSPDLVIDNNEPSALAAYLFKNNDDFRKMLTAEFCVSDFNSGLTQKTSCLHQGRIQKNDNNTNDPARFYSQAPARDMLAGAISTQAFLKKYAGALNFRRAAKTREFFLCSNYPDPEETAGWTQQNTLLHPFYWTPAGGDQDCQRCHSGLNRVRGFFTAFGSLGELQMGQRVPRLSDNQMATVGTMTINDVERTLIALPNYETLYGKTRNTPFERVLDSFHGETLNLISASANSNYPKLSDYGRILAANPRFASCTAQRFYNFALGIGQSFLNKVPDRLVERLPQVLVEANYNIKPLLLAIFSTTDFLNR